MTVWSYLPRTVVRPPVQKLCTCGPARLTLATFRLRCFHYIHHNAVKDGLVAVAEDYPYSSAREWAGLRDNGLCAFSEATQLLGVQRGPSGSPNT